MLKLSRSTKDQRGDTIVEVMVVLAILGLAIGISYATANRSLLSTRAAQENSQATELLQGQVELLRAYSTAPSTDRNYIYKPGQSFCFNLTVPTPPQVELTIPASNCYVDGLYNVSIQYAGVPDDTFTTTATWPDAAGQGTDSSTIIYRIHKP